MKKIKMFLYKLICKLSLLKIIKLNDETYIKLKYYSRFGKFPNLNNPQTFNEKLQWLKLHDRDDKYTILVDKY